LAQPKTHQENQLMFERGWTFHIGLLLGVALLIAMPSRAEVTYTDLASWSAAVTGTIDSVTIPEPAGPPPDCVTDVDCFFGTGSASVTYSGVLFSQSGALSPGNNFFNVGTGFSGGPPVLSSQSPPPPPNSVANILISLPTFTDALALNYDTFNGSPVTFTLSNGDVIHQGSSATGYSASDFFGVTSTPFDSVLVTATNDVLNLNNVSYVTPVPEPGDQALVAISLLGLIYLVGRRRGGLGVLKRRRTEITATSVISDNRFDSSHVRA
jgi:hypothetical protein